MEENWDWGKMMEQDTEWWMGVVWAAEGFVGRREVGFGGGVVEKRLVEVEEEWKCLWE